MRRLVSLIASGFLERVLSANGSRQRNFDVYRVDGQSHSMCLDSLIASGLLERVLSANGYSQRNFDVQWLVGKSHLCHCQNGLTVVPPEAPHLHCRSLAECGAPVNLVLGLNESLKEDK